MASISLWLQDHVTGSVYLTLSTMATLALILAWALREWGQKRGRNSLPPWVIRLLFAFLCACLVGLGLNNEWNIPEPWSLMIATGFGMVLILGFVFVPAACRRLTHRRYLRQAQACQGRFGQVYRTILPGQSGEVRIWKFGHTLNLSAQASLPHQKIEAFTRITILRVNSDGVAVVQAIQ